MKVLQINSFFTVGGPPRIMNGIYDTLKENGLECKIAASREKMYVPEDSYQICTDKSVKINALKARLFDNEGFNATKETKKLIAYISEYDPDIIHLHNLHGYVLNVEVLFDYFKEIQKPVVWTLHDCWTFTGHCAYFDAIACKQWKTKCVDCKQLKTYPACIGKGRVSKNFELKKSCFLGLKNLTFVTPSAWLAEYVNESFLGVYPVRVIHNGISLEQFHPIHGSFVEKNGLEKKRIVLGLAQVWNERKGYDDFLKLADMLDSDYQVIMVGLTQKQVESLPENIIGITRTNNVKELIDIYTAADIFVNFTYEDNFPTVNIEALACGTPVLTYRTGGSPEAIDESCGWVVEQGDIGAAKKIITGMGAKTQYLDSCIRRSKDFDRKERYLEYIDLYETVLGERL